MPESLLWAAQRGNGAFHAHSLGARCSRVLGSAFGLNLVSAEIPVGLVITVNNRLGSVFEGVRQRISAHVGYGNRFGILGKSEADLPAVALNGSLGDNPTHADMVAGGLRLRQLIDRHVVGFVFLEAGDALPGDDGKDNADADDELPSQEFIVHI